RQLKAHTGRESAAVSRAVDTLVKRGLIVVRDRFNRRLYSTAERRRSRSGLVFAIHPLFLESALYRRRIGLGDFTLRSSQSENNKSNYHSKKETKRDYYA
ncbi:MAG: hypothetical protein EDM74_14025, partial [Armatimonadetes bacterium]